MFNTLQHIPPTISFIAFSRNYMSNHMRISRHFENSIQTLRYNGKTFLSLDNNSLIMKQIWLWIIVDMKTFD